MSCRRESPQREFTPVLVLGREFHSGTKSHGSIMYTRNDHPFQREVGLPVDLGGWRMRNVHLNVFFRAVAHKEEN